MDRDRWREFVQRFQAGAHQDFAEHWQLYQSLSGSGTVPVWWPGDQELETSNVAWLLGVTGQASYRDLHHWSVENREAFWERVIDRVGVRFHTPSDRVLDLSSGVEQPVWLEGARYNIVESCFQAPPDATAIVFASEADPHPRTLSYGDLERQVCRVTNGLRQGGFREDDAIALYMPMTVECVAAYLGIIAAGCRVVSVADSFSAAELRKRMEITGAVAVVTLATYSWAGLQIDLYQKVRAALEDSSQDARAIVIPGANPGDLEIADTDLLWDDFLGSSEKPGFSIGPPDRVTNVLFSSGTTGDPKAIPWTQLTPIKCAMDAHFHQDVRPADVVAWPTNIGWMMGPWLIYAALLNRAAMALFQGAPHGDGFIRFVETAGVTMLGLVPALVRAWRTRNLVGPNSWTQIRLFSSTGEVSNPEDSLWLMSRAGYRAPIIEYLGGTEIGGGLATGSVLLPAAPSAFSTPALGLDFVILNEAGLPTSPGELGELFLIPPSVGLSQTLLNKDHHEIYYAGCPTGPDGETLRRHGDEFIAIGDGHFKAQGRTDDTMNLGGIKVSSIELEEVINEHPDVFESAAIAVQLRGEGAASLVVYIVATSDPDLQQTAQDLNRRIAVELNPLFKIHEVVPVDTLPRTASNKVMRRELRDLYLQSRSQQA